MPTATAPTMQPTTVPPLPMSGGAAGIASSPTVATNTLHVPQQTPVPASPPPWMASGALAPLNFAQPVHPSPVTPRSF
eukprot:3605171-Rhodomonas_salina.2